MTKEEFIRISPDYYICAIALRCAPSGLDPRDVVTKVDDLFIMYSGGKTKHGEDYFLNGPILREALRRLDETAHVDVLYDPFGPIQLRVQPSFGDWTREQRQMRGTVLHRAASSRDPLEWIERALIRLNHESKDFGIEDKDYRVNVTEWEPIALERDSKPLQQAIEAVDTALQEIESSNGYAAEHPEERGYVVDNLKLVVNKLKTALTISYGYLRTHGINVLQKVADKFSGAAMGEASKEALKALGRWLHEVMPSIF